MASLPRPAIAVWFEPDQPVMAEATGPSCHMATILVADA